MTVPFGPFVSRCGAPLAAALVLMAAAPAWPQAGAPQLQVAPGVQQQAPAQPQAPQDQPAPQPTPENPGLIHEMGKLIDKLKPSIKSPSETVDDLNARAKGAAQDAGDALSRLKPGTPVSGRTICPPATDRTPDCQAAADWLCKNK